MARGIAVIFNNGKICSREITAGIVKWMSFYSKNWKSVAKKQFGENAAIFGFS
jgi:hypothetical protein